MPPVRQPPPGTTETSPAAAAPRTLNLRLWMLAPVLVISVGLLLMPMPRLDRIGRAVSDLAHAPCFAVLAAVVTLIVTRGRQRGGAVVAIVCWIALVGFGCLTELAQGLVGRNVSLDDATANILGVTAGIMIAAAYGSQRKRLTLLLRSTGLVLILAGLAQPLLTLVDVYVAWRNFPRLADFEWRLETWRWSSHDARLTRSQEHPTSGRYCARLDLQPAGYPGALLRLPAGDWAEYDALLLDIVRPDPSEQETDLPASQTLELTIKIQDRQHNDQYEDRFHRKVSLLPGSHTVRIPVTEIAAAPRDRWMDLSDLRFLQIFGQGVTHPTTIYIDNIRLE